MGVASLGKYWKPNLFQAATAGAGKGAWAQRSQKTQISVLHDKVESIIVSENGSLFNIPCCKFYQRVSRIRNPPFCVNVPGVQSQKQEANACLIKSPKIYSRQIEKTGELLNNPTEGDTCSAFQKDLRPPGSLHIKVKSNAFCPATDSIVRTRPRDAEPSAVLSGAAEAAWALWRKSVKQETTCHVAHRLAQVGNRRRAQLGTLQLFEQLKSKVFVLVQSPQLNPSSCSSRRIFY